MEMAAVSGPHAPRMEQHRDTWVWRAVSMVNLLSLSLPQRSEEIGRDREGEAGRRLAEMSKNMLSGLPI